MLYAKTITQYRVRKLLAEALLVALFLAAAVIVAVLALAGFSVVVAVV